MCIRTTTKIEMVSGYGVMNLHLFLDQHTCTILQLPTSCQSQEQDIMLRSAMQIHNKKKKECKGKNQKDKG